jgi:hypothetical protein
MGGIELERSDSSLPAHPGCPVLSPAKIIVIAADAGLRDSLAFSLEVEGYQVEAYDAWCESGASLLPCLKIIDDQVIKDSQAAFDYVCRETGAVILLADGISPAPENVRAEILTKPFEGADLVRLVKTLAFAA